MVVFKLRLLYFYLLLYKRICCWYSLNCVKKVEAIQWLPATYAFYITKTCLYNFDPLKPHFYTVKLGFTGVNLIFLISAQNIDCGYSLEPPRRGARIGSSNEYPQSMFWAEIWKISEFFYLKIFSFFEVKFSIYLNRRVFVMKENQKKYCISIIK